MSEAAINALKEVGRRFCEELERKFEDPTASFDAAADLQLVLKDR